MLGNLGPDSSGVPPIASKMFIWPLRRSWAADWPASIAWSRAAIIWARLAPRESNAPHLTRASMVCAVDRVQVHLFAEVVEVGEASGLGAGLRDGLHGSHAHALDRGQAEPNALAVDGEVAVAQVDVRRGDLDAHAGGLGHVLDDLVGVGAFKGHRGGQELARVVHFEVGGLVGDDRVARRVGTC